MHRRETGNLYCKRCQRHTKHERFVTAMGCGDLVMVLLTGGLWLLGRQALKRWTCDRCGTANK